MRISDWSSDVCSSDLRYAAKAEIETLVAEKIATQSTAYWLGELRAARIPCGPVNNLKQALGDAQVRARDMVVDVELASGQIVSMPGNPVKLSGSVPARYARPPEVGEHTLANLENLLNYSETCIQRLPAGGAIGRSRSRGREGK